MAWKQCFSTFPFLLPDVKTGAHQSDFCLSLHINRSRYPGPVPKPVVIRVGPRGRLNPASLGLGGGTPWTLLIWTPLCSHSLDLKLQKASVLSSSFQGEQPYFPDHPQSLLLGECQTILFFFPLFFYPASTSRPHSFWSSWFLIPLWINSRPICLF